jgi:hypothetical protein
MLREIDGIRQRYGFYTTVFVEAFTASDAESRAIEVLREDAHLRDVALNAEDDPWTCSADEVHEIESFDGVRLPRQGLALYEEKSNDAKDVA